MAPRGVLTSADGSVADSMRMSRSVSWGATHLREEGRVEFRSVVGETIDSSPLPANQSPVHPP